jgi:hypothetical protein
MQQSELYIVNRDLTAMEDALIDAIRAGVWSPLPFTSEEEIADGLEAGFTPQQLADEVKKAEAARISICEKISRL